MKSGRRRRRRRRRRVSCEQTSSVLALQGGPFAVQAWLSISLRCSKGIPISVCCYLPVKWSACLSPVFLSHCLTQHHRHVILFCVKVPHVNRVPTQSLSWSLDVAVRDELQAAQRRITNECFGFMGIFFLLWGKIISFIKLILSEHGRTPTVSLTDGVKLWAAVAVCVCMFSRWGLETTVCVIHCGGRVWMRYDCWTPCFDLSHTL